MQCPACSYEPADGEGDGVSCPNCHVFYHKVLARQLEEARKSVAQRKAAAIKRKQRSEPAWLRLVKLFAFSVLMFVFLVGLVTCVMRDSPSSSARMTELDRKVAGRDSVLNRLRDPDSAVFTNEIIGRDGVLCGEVNAKNGFGGFTGKKRFISGVGGALMEGDVDAVAFSNSWLKICQ